MLLYCEKTLAIIAELQATLKTTKLFVTSHVNDGPNAWLMHDRDVYIF